MVPSSIIWWMCWWIWISISLSSYVDSNMVSTWYYLLVNLYLHLCFLTRSTVEKLEVPTTIQTMKFGEAFCHSTAMDNVTRVVGPPRVYGLKGDEGSFVCIMRAAVGWDIFDNPSLMDGGTNICITGILGLLVDVISIPPSPILVANTSGSLLLDDCCTKWGLIWLTLSEGSVYYQPCYYC